MRMYSDQLLGAAHCMHFIYNHDSLCILTSYWVNAIHKYLITIITKIKWGWLQKKVMLLPSSKFLRSFLGKKVYQLGMVKLKRTISLNWGKHSSTLVWYLLQYLVIQVQYSFFCWDSKHIPYLSASVESTFYCNL